MLKEYPRLLADDPTYAERLGVDEPLDMIVGTGPYILEKFEHGTKCLRGIRCACHVHIPRV